MYPTLVDLAGIPKKEGLDGKSLKSLINPSMKWNDPSFPRKGNHVVRSKMAIYSVRDGSYFDQQNDPNEL